MRMLTKWLPVFAATALLGAAVPAAADDLLVPVHHKWGHHGGPHRGQHYAPPAYYPPPRPVYRRPPPVYYAPPPPRYYQPAPAPGLYLRF